MGKVKVTYTRNQLRDFTIAELKTLDLFKRSKTKSTAKADIIKDMLDTQKSEKVKAKVSKPKAKAKAKPEATKSSPKEVKKAIDGKPVFHRVKRRVNPHMH